MVSVLRYTETGLEVPAQGTSELFPVYRITPPASDLPSPYSGIRSEGYVPTANLPQWAYDLNTGISRDGLASTDQTQVRVRLGMLEFVIVPIGTKVPGFVPPHTAEVIEAPSTPAPIPVFPVDYGPDVAAGAPANGEEGVPQDPAQVVLAWPAVQNAVQYNVYFGNNPNPPVLVLALVDLMFNLAQYVIDNLILQEIYYWRVGAVNADNVEVLGPIWNFQVEAGGGV